LATKGQQCFSQTGTRLNEILTNYNIAVSVHTLTLGFNDQTFEDSTSVALMSAILYRLSHIRSFTLEASIACSYFCGYPEDFASAIRALCRSPSLTTLSLHRIQGFPFTAITGCPNLQSLHLGVVIFEVNLIFSALFHINSPYIPVRQRKFEG
jgi:hypothetical protein